MADSLFGKRTGSVMGEMAGVKTVFLGLAGVIAALIVAVLGSRAALAATTDSGTTTVTFNIAEAIEVTSWPTSTFTLSSSATPGVAEVSDPLSITVRSNTNWGVQVQTDQSEGSLREFDVTVGSYVMDGKELGPLEWATNVNGPWTPLSSTPATMFSGQPATGEAGASVGFVLRATPSFDDAPLPAGRVYRIVLTYTAGVGF